MAKKRAPLKRPTTTGSSPDREILATLKEISRKLTDVLRELRELRAKQPQVFDEGGEGG